MKPFSENVIQIIKQIPPGKVMTYGQIAKLAGSPRGARQVVRVLHSMSKKYNLPWFRVINSKGEIAIHDEETQTAQIIFLEDEGVEVVNRSIDLKKYQYHPEEKA
ncbi:MGMT family protein [Bacillus sp. JJ1521]|uniref:MGMT family protein n=1 Tax=Bacillus sp. JJ1521 TaxID=3122957 RepID=UPI003000860E